MVQPALPDQLITILIVRLHKHHQHQLRKPLQLRRQTQLQRQRQRQLRKQTELKARMDYRFHSVRQLRYLQFLQTEMSELEQQLHHKL